MRKMSEKRHDMEVMADQHLDQSAEMEHFEWSQEELMPQQQTDYKGHNDSPGSGSAVGKLKLTSQMKEKLEAVTGGGGGSGSRKNSIKSTASKKSDDGSIDEATVGILAEKKKLLIEQKLGAGNDIFYFFSPFFHNFLGVSFLKTVSG